MVGQPSMVEGGLPYDVCMERMKKWRDEPPRDLTISNIFGSTLIVSALIRRAKMTNGNGG